MRSRTTAEPSLVVEVDADTCFERRRWRHATTYRRIRGDLEPPDLAQLPRDHAGDSPEIVPCVQPEDQTSEVDG